MPSSIALRSPLLLLLLLIVLPYCDSQAAARQIWAWANGNAENAQDQIRQLNNATWNSIIDGIQAWCGCSFTETGLKLDQTAWDGCTPLFQAAKSSNTKFQLIISGSIPHNAPVDKFVMDALALHHHLRKSSNLVGFSLDDERDCAPRATTRDFVAWTTWQSLFAQGLRPHGLAVTSAIQAAFGIGTAPENRPCDQSPSNYTFDPQVVQALQTATLQRWLIMDTYYFSTGRFMGALDWHVTYVPLDILGIGLMNRPNDLSEDDLVARFHAMDVSGVNWINIFMLPIAEEFLPFLQRWKTFCSSCGKQTVLGCYDMTISCDQGIVTSEL